MDRWIVQHWQSAECCNDSYLKKHSLCIKVIAVREPLSGSQRNEGIHRLVRQPTVSHTMDCPTSQLYSNKVSEMDRDIWFADACGASLIFSLGIGSRIRRHVRWWCLTLTKHCRRALRTFPQSPFQRSIGMFPWSTRCKEQNADDRTQGVRRFLSTRCNKAQAPHARTEKGMGPFQASGSAKE